MTDKTYPKLCFIGKNVLGASISYWCEPLQRNLHATFGSDDEHQVWNEGPPPFPGWWNAHFNPSYKGAPDVWRWWDGKCWSVGNLGCRAQSIIPVTERLWMNKRNRPHYDIKWNDRWPKGARVPRMIPEGYEQFEVLRGICGGLELPSAQLTLPLEEPKTLQQQLEESDW